VTIKATWTLRLKAKAEQHRDNCGVDDHLSFYTRCVEEGTLRLQSHSRQWRTSYMDGANMNALVGMCRPGSFRPRLSHLNLHKTFSIPTVVVTRRGPIGVAAHLKDFLPTHLLIPEAGPKQGISAGRRPPWQREYSADLLGLHHDDGAEGLRKATLVSILSANYMPKN